MNSKKVLRATSTVFVCIAFYFLGRYAGQSSRGASDAKKADVSDNELIGIEESASMPAIEIVKISDDKAVQMAKAAVCEIFSAHLEESVVVSTGRYKLVAFRIWHNPHDPKPPVPDVWHSPVWIDAETGAVVPPQLPDWVPLSDDRLKALVMEQNTDLQGTSDWDWSFGHVSGFARVIVRDPSPPPNNPWVEDGAPMVFEIWVDETREAVICAMEI